MIDQTWFGAQSPTGPSLSEKEAYYTENLAKAQAGTYTGHEITANYEPLPGWTPFKNTGKTTAAEMVAALARTWDTNNGDYNALVPGDWFTFVMDGTFYRYECQGRDQYYVSGSTGQSGKHHYTFVPDRLYPTAMAYSSSNSSDWNNSDLRKWMEGTFYDSLPTAVKNSIITMRIPFTSQTGERFDYIGKIFPPSEIEAFGKKTYSAETAGGTPPNNPYPVLSRSDANRKRTGTNANWYWLRSAGSSYAGSVPVVNADGRAGSYLASNTYGGALPCFNLG